MDRLLQHCLSLVEEGSLEQFFGGETIQEVFAVFFDSPHWRCLLLADQSYCVAFTGKAYYDDRLCLFLFQFSVQPEEESFSMETVKVGEELLEEQEAEELLEDIYSFYLEEIAPAPNTLLAPYEEADEEALLQADLEDCEELVRTGTFDEFQGATVEQLFEDFFVDCSWEPILGSDDCYYVNFTGIANYHSRRAKFLFQFSISDDGEFFEVAALEINGVPMPEQKLGAVLADLFRSYRDQEQR